MKLSYSTVIPHPYLSTLKKLECWPKQRGRHDTIRRLFSHTTPSPVGLEGKFQLGEGLQNVHVDIPSVTLFTITFVGMMSTTFIITRHSQNYAR